MNFRIQLYGTQTHVRTLAQCSSLENACAIAHLLAGKYRGQPGQIWVGIAKGSQTHHLTGDYCDSLDKFCIPKTEQEWNTSAIRALNKFKEEQRAKQARSHWIIAHDGCYERIMADEHLRTLLFANRFPELEAALQPQPALS